MPRTISPRSGHEITKEQAAKGGRNSKRPPSVKSQFKAILQNKLSAADLKKLKKLTDEKGGDALDLLASLSQATGDKRFDTLIAMAQTVKAVLGDTQAAKFIAEHTDGKPKETVEHQGEVKRVLEIVFPEEE